MTEIYNPIKTVLGSDKNGKIKSRVQKNDGE